MIWTNNCRNHHNERSNGQTKTRPDNNFVESYCKFLVLAFHPDSIFKLLRLCEFSTGFSSGLFFLIGIEAFIFPFALTCVCYSFVVYLHL